MAVATAAAAAAAVPQVCSRLQNSICCHNQAVSFLAIYADFLTMISHTDKILSCIMRYYRSVEIKSTETTTTETATETHQQLEACCRIPSIGCPPKAPAAASGSMSPTKSKTICLYAVACGVVQLARVLRNPTPDEFVQHMLDNQSRMSHESKTLEGMSRLDYEVQLMCVKGRR